MQTSASVPPPPPGVPARAAGSPRRPLFPDYPMSGGAWYILGAICWLVALVVIPWLTPTLLVDGKLLTLAPAVLLGTLTGSALFMIGAGISITGLRRGIMLGGRNTFSLSRLQMVLWTWLILSALMALATVRAWGMFPGVTDAGPGNALSIDLDGNLLAVMGIAFGSAAVTPAILTLQTRDDTGYPPVATFRSRLRGMAFVRGRVVYRATSREARFEDLIKGDDTGSAGAIDLSKVQNLMLTVILVGYYLVMLFDLFRDSAAFGAVAAMPGVSAGMLTLLGISHAGYLAYKAAPKPGEQAREGLVAYAGPGQGVQAAGAPASPPPAAPANVAPKTGSDKPAASRKGGKDAEA
ncbi:MULTISPECIES: hypothetical protein [Asticcacaulis]|uniref:hypothetical protein n=1 Tax=Asticcacaulis TaxID=76890 RepID=UPI001AE6968E|nr:MULTISPECIES: hypothetical protein [Asticcacaulis]MBP2158715.1 hypothetical protein [Asticcacaulis solisilvae]MDR6799761.1 hypothetical protein [Asticcacaulis sp. BE141]